MDTFIKTGIHCAYIADSMTRRPTMCKIVGKMSSKRDRGSVYKVAVLGPSDLVLGDGFFVTFDATGAKHPDVIVSVDVYTRYQAWLSPVREPVEFGFLCLESYVAEMFPSLDGWMGGLIG